MREPGMRNSIGTLTLVLLLIHQPVGAQLKYEVPDQPWLESFGNHRAVLQVDESRDAVALELGWRRHDRNPADRKFIIVSASTGDTVQNICRYEVSQEQCRLVFGPVSHPGMYYFYYLPYEPVYEFYHAGPYQLPEDPPDNGWMERNHLAGKMEDFEMIPACDVLRIEARSKFDAFYPMEVPATHSELSDYLQRNDDLYLVFPEDRSRPIKMRDALPWIWMQDKPPDQFKGIVQKNEYYVLQLGVYASKVRLPNLEVSFSDLRSDDGQTIPSASITCFNTHGVDIEGNPFTKQLNVEEGNIQSLWIGIDVPGDMTPGVYKGFFTVSAYGQEKKKIRIELEVQDSMLADRGDGETWRHSRLRWLNSTIGIDEEPVAPYTALKVDGKAISLLGRQVVIDDYGFPIQVKAWGHEVLAAPVRFIIESQNRIMPLEATRFTFTKQESGIISWEALAENDRLSLTCRAEMEFDGYMKYKCVVQAKDSIHIQDVRLEIPYRKDMATYMIGMSRMGGYTPEFHTSRWRREEDSFWIGNTRGGIHCELRGGPYHGPLLNLYQPDHPRSWYNGANGGFRVDTRGDVVTAAAFSGYRPMRPGQAAFFEFTLIITPVKAYDPDDQFRYRYEHNPHPRELVVKHGGNVMNVHHANEYNPFINYPFLANEKLKSLVDQWHDKDWKVKIYYTVRELSNQLTELWALRSLGFEILADGPGGGYQWLQEHLVDHYTYQWYTRITDGNVDAAILNSGESRWYNYYLEGLAWLLREIDIDGLYLDDFSFDRRILKRMRKIMEDNKPGACHIDVHSNTAFSRGPANQYLEIYPFINRTWYGEGFNFDLMPPEFWLSEVSGVPFGVVNELLLHRSVNKGRRGMLYAMAPRGDWSMWKFWDSFRISEAEMMGYWEDNPPVTSETDQVKITTYRKDKETLIVLGSWLNEPADVPIQINWKALGLNKNKVKAWFPGIDNYQNSGTHPIDDPVPLEAKGVRFLILSEKP